MCISSHYCFCAYVSILTPQVYGKIFQRSPQVVTDNLLNCHLISEDFPVNPIQNDPLSDLFSHLSVLPAVIHVTDVRDFVFVILAFLDFFSPYHTKIEGICCLFTQLQLYKVVVAVAVVAVAVVAVAVAVVAVAVVAVAVAVLAVVAVAVAAVALWSAAVATPAAAPVAVAVGRAVASRSAAAASRSVAARNAAVRMAASLWVSAVAN
ncbi:hypothetical protein STEG23_028497 [Scotinomys teguina]